MGNHFSKKPRLNSATMESQKYGNEPIKLVRPGKTKSSTPPRRQAMMTPRIVPITKLSSSVTAPKRTVHINPVAMTADTLAG